MSFASLETSLDSAMPFELFEIRYTGNVWHYTNADQDIVFQGVTYKAVPCSHDDIEQSITGDKTALTLQFPFDIPFAEVYRIQPPSEIVTLRILAQNYLDMSDYVTMWKGRILNCAWKWPWVEVIAESATVSTNRAGLRRRYSTSCPHNLYGQQCGVLREAFRDAAVANVVSGMSVTAYGAIGKPDNHYAGGYMTWINAERANTERRMIVSSVGATGALELASLPVGLQTGQDIAIFAGCDHTISTCESKFNNSANCGAIPYIPKKNPFGGTTLY